MTEAELLVWFASSKAEYLDDLLRAGETRDQAQVSVDQSFERYFPAGVPTADADLREREARLQRYKEAGQNLLFFAASFIPVVGEVLLVVTGAQLINSVYHGLAAWSRGDSEEAINDLMDVVDSAAGGQRVPADP